MSYELVANRVVQDMIEDQVYHTHIAGSEVDPQEAQFLLLNHQDIEGQHHHRMIAHDFQNEEQQRIATELIQQQQEAIQEPAQRGQQFTYANNTDNINYELALKLFQQIPQTQMDANSIGLLKQLEERLKIISQLDAQEKELAKKKNESEYNLRRIEQNQLKASQLGTLTTSMSNTNNIINNNNNNNNNTNHHHNVNLLNSNQGNMLENRSLVNSYVIQNSTHLDTYGNYVAKSIGKSQNQNFAPYNNQQLFSEGKYGIAASLRNNSQGAPNVAYNNKKDILNFNVREEMKCTFHPSINKKSEKMVNRGQGDKNYSVKYLYQDALQRQEREKSKLEMEMYNVKAQMTKSKIDPKSQKIILKKIDKVLSFIINQVQEGDFISYESLGLVYQEIGLFRALHFQKDQNQTSLFLQDRKNLDLNRLHQEMKFHEQSFRIFNLNNSESGLSKKLTFDVLMILIEKKILNPQAEFYLKEILLNSLQIETTNPEERQLILDQLLQESTVPQDSLSNGENWDIPALVANFRKLHDDKTNLMEWYSSKNNNILNDIKLLSDSNNINSAQNSDSQNNLDEKDVKSKSLRNSMTNAELKFHPKINKKSKLLDSCLMMSQSGTYFARAQTAKNVGGSNPSDNFTSELNLSQKSAKKSENQKKRHEILYEHAKYLEQKKKEQKEIVEKEINDKCTFKPTVNLKSSTIQASKSIVEASQQQGDLRMSVYDKLYQKHGHREEELTIARSKVFEERQVKEGQECTFRPAINYGAPFMKTPEEQEKLVSIKGTSQLIERFQKARIQQQEKDSFFERQRQMLSQSASRFTETQPFSFDQQNSINKIGNQSIRKDREILGNVDVNFSKGKKGRIIIYKGDNPEDLALSFAKIYSLNDEMRFTLKEMIAEYIQKMENEASSSEEENKQKIQTADGGNHQGHHQQHYDEDDQGISNKSVRGEDYEEGNGTSAVESVDNMNQIRGKENESIQGDQVNSAQVKEIIAGLMGQNEQNEIKEE